MCYNKTHHPRVSIILINWNGWEDTIECLESLYQINYSDYDIIIVDNDSTDNSIYYIKEYCNGKIKPESKFFDYNKTNKPINFFEYDPINHDHIEVSQFSPNKNLVIIKNGKNSGFAEGNNIGIRYALKNFNPDYILLLNNDTVVDRNFLNELTITAKRKDIGILGSKIYYYSDPQRLWFAGGKISWKIGRGVHIGLNQIDSGQFNENSSVDYITGCVLLIKRELIEKIGLLDPEYFIYFEETDWNMRSKNEGYESEYVYKSKVWHKVAQSTGALSGEVGLYYLTRNRWVFMKKWASKSNYSVFILLQIFAALILPLILVIYYKKIVLFKSYYHGLYDGIQV